MAAPLGTIVQVTGVTTKQAATTSPNNVANLYGMLVHADPNNTVNLRLHLGSSATTYYTLTPDSAIRLDPAQCPNTGQLYVEAADDATASNVEIVL